MKKLGLGLITVILVAVIYYFTAGSEQLTEEMKVRVNTELSMIEQNGFSIQEREVKEKKEHFVLTFDDPQKIMTFFKKQGSEIALEDAQALIGIKLGVDLAYLNDTYSALSVDIYPLNLPTAINNAAANNDADKALVTHLNTMLKQKALLVHVDFNKMLSSFKGFIKDIDETYTTEKAITMTLKGATFEGEINDDRITKLSQVLQTIQLTLGDDLTLALSGLKSDYALTGKTLYNSNYDYSVETIKVSGKHENETFSALLKQIEGSNKTSVANNLASNKMKFFTKRIEVEENSEKTNLTDVTFSFDIANLDMSILGQFEEVDIENETETNRLIQALISKGITMEIPLFEVKKLDYLGENIDGFALTSTFEVNKDANFAGIQANPFSALDAINTKTTLTLSDALFNLIAKDPRAMMLAMLIQPKVVNGKKVYEVEIKDGKLTVNGKPMI